MKINALMVIFLLAITLVSGSGCIDSSGTVKETELEEMADNLNASNSDPVTETRQKEMTDRLGVSFNNTWETVPVENFLKRAIPLKLKRKAPFPDITAKKTCSLRLMSPLILCL
ncbi:hypothetical protein MSHOH_3663 [Methanosarcina horonobensis HB-1 = JCM 15518]|uniref:Uncharacterized protein n=1 Tax=Methanosarcina horonobensis HB-1 = JCM 15518 TaxID=1434110 RepID=A0A0E3SG84_9EURY|nr:hypothetical protein MSHOH_3663 [Methanosarcina horonobensis HB-1 = JCM 15518]